MLQKFLDLNFIKIKEDANLAKLKKASGELVRKLSKKKAKVIAYTLIALDPEVRANNSDLNEVKKIIIKNWKTFSSNRGDTPVTFIRAVILEALETISKETRFASLIWLAGRNVIKHYKLGREDILLTKFLLDLGNKIEKEAVESWSLHSESKLEKLSLDIKELAGATIHKATLQKYLGNASGPQNQDGQPYSESHNPHWSTAQQWAWEFAPIAAQGIANVINKALKEQAEAVNTNQSQIQEAVDKLLVQTQAEILQKNNLLHMRTQLLWWKEACYSSSLRQSYRRLKDGLLQLTLANDYASFVPFIYPTSADYFLQETHRDLISDTEKDKVKKMKISEILKLCRSIKHRIENNLCRV